MYDTLNYKQNALYTWWKKDIQIRPGFQVPSATQTAIKKASTTAKKIMFETLGREQR